MVFAIICKRSCQWQLLHKKKNAGDGTWTHTILRPQAPEACASANSATSACRTDKSYCNYFRGRCQQQNLFFIIKNLSLTFMGSFVTITRSRGECGSVGTGRRARLRILCLLQACGFKSHLPHWVKRLRMLDNSSVLGFLFWKIGWFCGVPYGFPR